MGKANFSNGDWHVAAAVLLGTASFLLLLTCISSPVFEGLRLYRIGYRFDSAIRWVDVGLWGYCVEKLKATTFAPLPPFDPTIREGCSRAAVGFRLDNVVANALHTPALDGLYSKAHTGLLGIIYPIAAGLSLLSCIFQTIIHLSKKTRSMVIQLSTAHVKAIIVYNIIAAVLVLFAFAVQLSVVVLARGKVAKLQVKNLDWRLTFDWGNTIWLTVVAFVCHLIDLIVLARMKKEASTFEHERQAKKSRGKKPKGKKGKKATSDVDESDVEQGQVDKLATESVEVLPAYNLEGYSSDKKT